MRRAVQNVSYLIVNTKTGSRHNHTSTQHLLPANAQGQTSSSSPQASFTITSFSLDDEPSVPSTKRRMGRPPVDTELQSASSEPSPPTPPTPFPPWTAPTPKHKRWSGPNDFLVHLSDRFERSRENFEESKTEEDFWAVVEDWQAKKRSHAGIRGSIWNIWRQVQAGKESEVTVGSDVDEETVFQFLGLIRQFSADLPLKLLVRFHTALPSPPASNQSIQRMLQYSLEANDSVSFRTILKQAQAMGIDLDRDREILFIRLQHYLQSASQLANPPLDETMTKVQNFINLCEATNKRGATWDAELWHILASADWTIWNTIEDPEGQTQRLIPRWQYVGAPLPSWRMSAIEDWKSSQRWKEDRAETFWRLLLDVRPKSGVTICVQELIRRLEWDEACNMVETELESLRASGANKQHRQHCFYTWLTCLLKGLLYSSHSSNQIIDFLKYFYDTHFPSRPNRLRKWPLQAQALNLVLKSCYNSELPHSDSLNILSQLSQSFTTVRSLDINADSTTSTHHSEDMLYTLSPQCARLLLDYGMREIQARATSSPSDAERLHSDVQNWWREWQLLLRPSRQRPETQEEKDWHALERAKNRLEQGKKGKLFAGSTVRDLWRKSFMNARRLGVV
ncbi:hypothetical protein BT69DRAFT_1298105 [Atractiella rhizophila]|nr:hypothetical protein BT69DRAFT_1298105 [Atractiella rhizophila]